MDIKQEFLENKSHLMRCQSKVMICVKAHNQSFVKKNHEQTIIEGKAISLKD